MIAKPFVFVTGFLTLVFCCSWLSSQTVDDINGTALDYSNTAPELSEACDCPADFVASANSPANPRGYQFQFGETTFALSALGRGFYFNDQRIEWTGQEETFGVEGAFAGAFRRQFNSWSAKLETEFFINQPYDRNILVDTPERVSHRGNFEFDTFEISQFYFEFARGDFAFSVGKRLSQFGRFYYPLHTNQQFDAPFIRTESINLRETGLQLNYTPGFWDITLAVVNGSEDLDTNSSKAGIARVGVNRDWGALGASVKWQDGIGSESQKLRNNHVGVDAMVRRGRWTLSGEVIYDEYGFRREFDPLDITWGRSIYNREQFFEGGLLNGVGYYVNLGYVSDRWTTNLSFGSFTPNVFTGDNIHDQVTNRGIVKAIRHFGKGLDLISTVIIENDVENAQAARTRRGVLVYSGLEYRF